MGDFFKDLNLKKTFQILAAVRVGRPGAVAAHVLNQGDGWFTSLNL